MDLISFSTASQLLDSASHFTKFLSGTTILLQLSTTNGKKNLLHLDTDSHLTPASGCGRRRESSSSPPLSAASRTPHQRRRIHTYASHFLSTLTIAPPLHECP